MALRNNKKQNTLVYVFYRLQNCNVNEWCRINLKVKGTRNKSYTIIKGDISLYITNQISI